jgi:hypothetical protein
MATVKVKAFRFTDDELELLDVIQGHTGIRSRTEALRTVLQYYAEAEGLDVGKPGAKADANKADKADKGEKAEKKK